MEYERGALHFGSLFFYKFRRFQIEHDGRQIEREFMAAVVLQEVQLRAWYIQAKAPRLKEGPPAEEEFRVIKQDIVEAIQAREHYRLRGLSSAMQLPTVNIHFADRVISAEEAYAMLDSMVEQAS